MEKFSKETLEFLSKVGGDDKKLLTIADRGSSTAITPGNILLFRYRPLEIIPVTCMITNRGLF